MTAKTDPATISSAACTMFDTLSMVHDGEVGEAFGTVRDLIEMGALPFEMVTEMVLGRRPLPELLDDAHDVQSDMTADLVADIDDDDERDEFEADQNKLLGAIKSSAATFRTASI